MTTKYFYTVFIASIFYLNASLYAMHGKEGIVTPEGDAASFDVGYFGVWQERFDSKPIGYLTSDTSLTAIEELNTGDIWPNYATGVRIAGELNPNPEESLQIIFIGFLNWNHHRVLIAPDKNLYIPINLIPVNNVSPAGWENIANLYFDYHELFFSFELCYWLHLTPRALDYFSFSVTGGGRYIGLKDNLEFLSSTGGNRQNTLRVTDNNRLIGGQIGVDITYWATERLLWATEFKFGLFPNFIDKWVYLTGGDTANVVTDGQHHHVTASYSFDLLTTMVYHLGPLYCRIGAEWLTIFNLALAPFQISLSIDLIDVDWIRSTTFKGLHVGLGANF